MSKGKKRARVSAKVPAMTFATSTQQMGDFEAAKGQMSELLLQPVKQGAFRAMAAATGPEPEQNVVGVGIGEKISDGKHTGMLAVKFLVRIKYSENEISKKQMLPKLVNGLPTDVEQVGTFRKFAAAAPIPNPRTKIRPAPPGSSVGFKDPANKFVMAGTFGLLAKDSHGVYVLSNNHVLADESRLPIGSPIFQPGLLDGGNPNTDQIAKLRRFVPLNAGVLNKVDCAIAEALKKTLVTNAILLIGPPRGVAPAQRDMVVHKFGRTTSYTVGRVTSINTDVAVQYDTGVFKFGGQIIIQGLNNTAFSAAGDSGSGILERGSNRVVGLLFAGSSSHTIANHIRDVLAALNVTLA